MAESIKYEIYEVAAAAYPRNYWDKPGRSFLTHAVVNNNPLCNRVAEDSLLYDTCSPGYQKNAGEPTCRTCRARLRKLLNGSAASASEG